MLDKNNNNSIQKTLTVFGNILNEISVDRTDNNGVVQKTIKVPLAYSPRQTYYKSLQNDINKKANLILPRIVFSMGDPAYDATRKLNSMNRSRRSHPTDPNLSVSTFDPVPYNIPFSVVIAAKNMTDSLRIIESILPFFTPELNVPIRYISSQDAYDVSFILDSLSQDDNYANGFAESRIITWTLNFTARAWIFHNSADVKRITKVIIEFSDDLENLPLNWSETSTYT